MDKENQYKCSWCQNVFKSKEEFDNGQDFWNELELVFAHGEAVPHFPWVYEQAELCGSCREKLHKKLMEMGIKFTKVETHGYGSEHGCTFVKEDDKWIKIS